jgi:hypothetical protein
MIMYKVSEESYKKAYKPLDIVTDEYGNVGMIHAVSVNNCQEDFEHQIEYSVQWLVGDVDKVAWFSHKELTSHCNIMVEIAKCCAGSHFERSVDKLFKHM